MDLKPGEKYNIQEISHGLCKHMPKKHHGDKVAGYHQQHRLVEKDQQQPLEITIRTRGQDTLQGNQIRTFQGKPQSGTNNDSEGEEDQKTIGLRFEENW